MIHDNRSDEVIENPWFVKELFLAIFGIEMSNVSYQISNVGRVYKPGFIFKESW